MVGCLERTSRVLLASVFSFYLNRDDLLLPCSSGKLSVLTLYTGKVCRTFLLLVVGCLITL